MTVSAQTPINRSTGNGVTTVFPYGFKILNKADILVTVDGVAKTVDVDYTVSGVGVEGGGNVTFTTAPANLSSVVRRRFMQLVRATDYQNQGELPAATLDEDLDRVVLMIQQVDEEVGRSLVLPAGVAGVSAELPAPVGGAFLGWNTAGDEIQNYAGMASAPVSLAMAPVVAAETLAAARTALDVMSTAEVLALTGQDYKASVRAATTTSINLSAPGAAIDGVSMVVGDRFLDKDNATASARGIYIWNGAAVPATRATDADGVGELTSGAVVAVEEGTTNADSQWMLTTDGAITIGTTALTFARKDAGAAATGFRNKFINGRMGIDQRNAGAAQTIIASAALAYTVDRWYAYCTGANVTGQRVAGTAPNDYNYRLTGAASVTKIGFAQRIESANCQDLAGQTATLSVDLANSLLTTVTWTAWYANTADTFGTLASPTRTQIATGTFTVNSTLTRYNTQISIPGAATTGIEVEFSVGAQTSGTFTIGRSQLEVGSVDTPFEHRHVGSELALCQRYYEAETASIQTLKVRENDGTRRAYIVFKATKRALPTVLLIGANADGGIAAPSVGSVGLGQARLDADAGGVTSAVPFITGWTSSSEL